MIDFTLTLILGMHEIACPLFIFYHCLDVFLTAINGEQDPIICGWLPIYQRFSCNNIISNVRKSQDQSYFFFKLS